MAMEEFFLLEKQKHGDCMESIGCVCQGNEGIPCQDLAGKCILKHQTCSE
jgi:hypothetical protein